MFVLYCFALAIALSVGAYLRCLAQWKARSRGLSPPPGPTGLPLVGNLFDMPKFNLRFAYRDLCQKYGDIVHLRAMGRSFVVLGNAEVVLEYLEKRSANTSDRIDSPLTEVTGLTMNFGFMPYGQLWRRHRREFWQCFHHNACAKYWPVQRAVAHEFLGLLLKDPLKFKEYIRYTFASSILQVVYGITPSTEDDLYVKMVEAALDAVAYGMVAGKWLVEYLPSLRYMPSWFPGSGEQTCFVEWRKACSVLKNAPFEHSKGAMDDERVRESVVGQLLKNLSVLKGSVAEEEEIVKNVGAVSFIGGSDTTYGALLATFLALSLHPEILRKAQAELDAVVGSDRLPDFSDRDALVYVNAIIMETSRWHVVGPLSGIHYTMEDDEFHGYFIPAGTALIPNTWACMHDSEMYPDPDAFRPERFIREGRIDPNVRDPNAFVFGYGRRACPGRHFALDGLFINVASVIHTFDITPPLDDNGAPIKIAYSQTDGMISYPEDCRCSIKPRSPSFEALILRHNTRVQAGVQSGDYNSS